MHVIKFLPALLFGVGRVLADGTTIANAIIAIQNATNELSTTVGNWDGDILGSLPIIAQSTSLLATINKGTETAKESSTLSDIEALTVGLATITLVDDVQASLDVIVDAKSKFDSDLLTAVVLLNLEEEKSASSAFSNAVVDTLPESFVETGEQLAEEIATAFDDAISIYSGGILRR